MPTPFEISDRLTEEWADLHPVAATYAGISGRDGECADLSPEGHERSADLQRSARARLLPHVDHPDPVQAFAAKVLAAEMDSLIEAHESGRWKRDLNHIRSPFQTVRDVFEVMPKASLDDWDNIRSRLSGFGAMLEGYRRCLAAGASEGDTAAARQVESVLGQVEHAASERSAFNSFPRAAAEAGADGEAVADAVAEARSACGELAAWLRASYLPAARPGDAVGEESYLREADRFLGMAMDPRETYDWGWSEIGRIRAEMTAAAAEIDPGKSLAEVIELLDTDPARSAATREEFVEFVSALQQEAVAQLDGRHFDVPDELRAVTVNIAPPGVPLGAWYVGPSQDFSRPGSIWYSPGGRDRLPYWQEVSTAYHEGFPGHHLQVGASVLQADKLSRFQRAFIWRPGSGEGWALYAERLMDELGFFERPEYRLGLLASQLFRSVRVVLDIGCQLELTVPDDAPIHGGEVWDFDIAVDYICRVGLQPRDVSESEVKRYLGWWGQAVSYKVGEREILSTRDEAARRPGFDRKDFHRRVLDAGAVRLDHLADALLPRDADKMSG